MLAKLKEKIREFSKEKHKNIVHSGKLKIKFIVFMLFIIICMLCIFNVIMVNFPINSVKDRKSEYLSQKGEAELVSDDSWELWMFMKDSGVNQGKDQLYSVSWHATTNETRVITIQINIRNTDVKTTYNPGELQITINNLGKVYPDYAGDYKEATNVAADEIRSEDKSFDWSYQYTGKEYIFTNNNTITQNHNFESSIQLAYEMEAKNVLNDSNIEINSTFKDLTSEVEVQSNNSLNFEFTSTERNAIITKRIDKVTSYDGLIENADEYYWVKYDIDLDTSSDKSTGVRGVVYDTYVSEKIPTGCVLLDGNQNKIDPDENGIYELPLVGKSSQKFTNTKDIGTRGYGDYYIGYPKEIYNGQTVTETTEWIGKIQDSYYKRGAEKQAKVLVTKDTTVNVNDYEVVVKETYSLGKSTFASQRSYHKITNSKYGENIEYSFSLGASYLGEKYTLKCGDDLVYITDADGNPRQLNDDEYYFKSVAIEGDQWRNGNGTIIEYEKYDMQLFVRYKNTEDYVPYGNMMKNNSNLTIKFSENNVVRLVYRSI